MLGQPVTVEIEASQQREAPRHKAVASAGKAGVLLEASVRTTAQGRGIEITVDSAKTSKKGATSTCDANKFLTQQAGPLGTLFRRQDCEDFVVEFTGQSVELLIALF
jgi:hypothetical protein